MVKAEPSILQCVIPAEQLPLTLNTVFVYRDLPCRQPEGSLRLRQLGSPFQPLLTAPVLPYEYLRQV